MSTKTTPKAKTMETFRAAHDKSVIVPNKIKARFAAMLKIGPEEYDYEMDFSKASGVALNDLAPFREMFEDHIVNVGSARNPKRVWFADAKVAKKARGV